MRIVVEGCGAWAMQYLSALRRLAPDAGVFFTYDSTFGLDSDPKFPAELFQSYLGQTLENAASVRAAGFATVDVKDTLFKKSGASNTLRRALPDSVDAVFVATPDRTHCDVAEYWLGRSRRIFVEKPFDTSSARIADFIDAMLRQDTSEVFGVDHYFVRCNQAARDQDYFMQWLFAVEDTERGTIPLEGFEFRMTEPPQIVDGTYSADAFRSRAPALQEGLAFDMGAHALPLLMPFVTDLNHVSIDHVWAGISEELAKFMYGGGETFSSALVTVPVRQPGLGRSRRVSGRFVVGKDLDNEPMKQLLLHGPKGSVRFDLVRYHVYAEVGDETIPLAALQEDWALFFVSEVLEGRIPRAVEKFGPGGAAAIVAFLEEWRLRCRQLGRDSGLSEYKPGASPEELETPRYASGRRLD